MRWSGSVLWRGKHPGGGGKAEDCRWVGVLEDSGEIVTVGLLPRVVEVLVF